MAYPYYNNYPQYSQQTQTTGCMVVPSEDDVQKYPVAPNTAMVFLLQDLSACYIKATGSSMLDAPRIQKYVRQTDEKAEKNVKETGEKPDFALKSDIDSIQKQIDNLNEQIKPFVRNKVKNNE